ncbi:hypothetical protein NQZ68_030999 [Dissostichus eleginoides]|nr:hypothetical protein NQZ68_030999 [Dissostichus eleginoides]
MGNHPSVWAPSPSRASLALLIPIEKGKGRLGKQERMKRRSGATEQAKGFTDIHGNLQIHSVPFFASHAAGILWSEKRVTH